MELKDIFDAFSELGIEIEIVEKKNVDSILDDGYKKVSERIGAGLDALLQFAPEYVVNAINNDSFEMAKELLEGAYVVKVKEGMHLAKSKVTEGAFRGTLLSNANNQISGQAELFKIDASQLSQVSNLALGVFDALSIVVGQYYMAQINHKLSALEKNTDRILGYLEIEKRSKLYANDTALNDILKNINTIRNSDNLKLVYLQQVCEIKRESCSNIIFFERLIKDKRDEINERSSGGDISENVKLLLDNYSQYWYSIYLYAKSFMSEVYLAEIDEPEYLKSVRDSIKSHTDRYKKDLEYDINRISRLIKGAKKLNKTSIPISLKNMNGNLYVAVIGGVIEIYNASAEKAAKNKTNIRGNMDILKNYRDISVLNAYEEELDRLINRLNSPIDIVSIDGDVYIKHLDEKSN